MIPRCCFAVALFVVVEVHVLAGDVDLPKVVEFNRDIRPIFADKCFACHGPDQNQRKADLRLDEEKNAMAERDGYRVIVPRDPAKSVLFARITEADGRRRMPPRKFNKTLTAREIALIERWIEQGARWQGHWSYIPPKRPDVPALPAGKLRPWPINEIDRFILARLQDQNLEPSNEADKRTLLRRLSFDLTGLPPTPEEYDQFVQDTSPDAYEKLVERLLASQHFGERMAIYWLDVVRYADTGGYHSDNHRDIWMYRDYVIKAFNDNKPFDQFTIEQLAGDLLPGRTNEQWVASGFNRLLQTTEEGGAQPKEYAAKYAADRVRNTSSIFLAITMGCCECHDHKFDPFTMKDFYSMEAFFADISERAVGRQPQTPILSKEDQARLASLDRDIEVLNRLLVAESPDLEAAQASWEAETLKKLGPRPKPTKELPANVIQALQTPAGKRNSGQTKLLRDHYRRIAPALQNENRLLAFLQKRKQDILDAAPKTLVSMSVPPRTIRLLPRGNWLDDSGPIMQPDVPATLPDLHVTGRRPNRLDFAKWLVSPENPMTARVFVNRLWKLFFGRGIVATLDDFGSQGAWPTHPKLLDWLAVEFRESGWDIKHMIRLMVLSRTYRQSSLVSEAKGKADPFNKWLARQGRFRLDAEMVRDNALAISGLLSRKLGGPSVKPYQPAGYWQHLNFPKRTWKQSAGEDLYRRGLYTYWQRTFLHPSLLAFDAPSREECTVDRPRSNTPLQALVLLNDPTYVEAARVFAERVMRSERGMEARIRFAFRRALCRQPTSDEIKVLSDLFQRHFKQYLQDDKAARALLQVGDYPVPDDLVPAELAAWTSVTRVILNLHETITRY
ncbi:MAG: chromosome segregation protein [Gemmatales bacterium]|nr:MAG: chromosome segregation protein [Gemmatales bacterium]